MENEWIVVHNGKVLAAGEEAFDIWRRADELGLGQPFLFLVERGIHVYLTIKAYLAEDDAVPLLLGIEDLITNARLVCDYPKSKAFLQF